MITITSTPVYESVYKLYTEGIRRYTYVVCKACIRDFYIRSRTSYPSLHMTVYIYCILAKAGRVLMLSVYGILTFVAGFLIHHYT